jgi:hypothetical protein
MNIKAKTVANHRYNLLASDDQENTLSAFWRTTTYYGINNSV